MTSSADTGPGLIATSGATSHIALGHPRSPSIVLDLIGAVQMT